jgi:transcriptional regulator with XRE-family HTH domain
VISPELTPQAPYIKHQHRRLPESVRKEIAARIRHVFYRKAIIRKGPDGSAFQDYQTWAEVIGDMMISETQLRSYRNGQAVPTLAILYELCRVSGFSPNWFMGFVPIDSEGTHVRPTDFNDLKHK